MKQYLIPFIILSILFTSLTSQAAPYVFGNFQKRQANRDASRWTLADWLAQKESFRAMDYWLAMNSSSNTFELFLSGAYSTPEVEVSGVSTTTSDTLSRADLGIFVTIFGLIGEWSQSDSDVEMADTRFQLRLFGKSTQSTSLSVHYGIQSYKVTGTSTEFQHPHWGGDIEVYFSKWFGMTGHYRKLLSDEADSGDKQEGQHWSAGVFLEWGMLRVFGQFLETKLTATPTAGADITTTTSGIESGLRVYF